MMFVLWFIHGTGGGCRLKNDFFKIDDRCNAAVLVESVASFDVDGPIGRQRGS